MKHSFLLFSFLLLYLFFCSGEINGQTLPVGTPVLEDAYRRAQLLGQLDSTVSFTARPFFPYSDLKIKNKFNPDSILNKGSINKSEGAFRIGKIKGEIKLLPVIWLHQFNSIRPFGFNDGAMIPAVGYQTLFSGGVFFKLGPLSIQLKPEFVYAENRSYQGFSEAQPEQVWEQYFNSVLNQIDMPERFGEKAYSKMSWGQSSIRLTFGPLSLGLSNENLWWGPGIQNSLLMSNTAPGFKHITLNTVRPLRTPIGSFESQIIVGKLDSSGYMPLEPARMALYKNLYVSKPNDWRYLNGFVFTYQPKWTPGIFLGMTRVFYLYSKDMGHSFSDYLPIIIPFQKINVGNTAEDAKKRDQLTSLFIRWLMVKEHAEFYFEFGRNDHSYDLRDLTLEPEHSRAYIFGITKLFTLNAKKNEFIQFNFESTQLEMTKTSENRDSPTWYVHYQVVDGYTNKGQVIGAGIGPGSNMQSINISWVKDLKMIGIGFDRIVNNNDFHYEAIKDDGSHWVDLGFSLFGKWNFKKLTLNARIEAIDAFNYEHLFIPRTYVFVSTNILSTHSELGLTYTF
jgi:hypothetical protein